MRSTSNNNHDHPSDGSNEVVIQEEVQDHENEHNLHEEGGCNAGSMLNCRFHKIMEMFLLECKFQSSKTTSKLSYFWKYNYLEWIGTVVDGLN